MSTRATLQTYTYLEPSSLGEAPDGPELRLSTSGGAEAHPFFFTGLLGHVRQNAALLLCVARVARTRFYVPAAVRNAAIRAADPVVTADGERLRFESFSVCNGVYARLDLAGGSARGEFVTHGSTNVDVNMPMRDALSRLTERDLVGLSVGADALLLSTLEGTVVEHKVPLPGRWLRGFAEAQVAQSRMGLRFEVTGAAAKRFLGLVARTQGKGTWWIQNVGDDLALSRDGGDVQIAGLERMRQLAEPARFVDRVRVYAADDGPDGRSAIAITLDLEDATMTWVLSPEVTRGFSGEGRVLDALADREAVAVAEEMEPWVRERQVVTVDTLGVELGPSSRLAIKVLDALGGMGCVGFDLALDSHFYRALPFEPDTLAKLHPRIGSAQDLHARGAVRITRRDGGTVKAEVTSGDAIYVVELDVGRARCTCRWYLDHEGARGPCKHVLAVRQDLDA